MKPDWRTAVWGLTFGLLAAILVASVVVLYEVDARQRQLCRATSENRTTLVGVVNATADLGRGLILGDAREQPDTPEEGAAIERVENFRDSQLKQLELPICED